MFYTKRGDEGYTDLLGGPRMPKDDNRIVAIGELDEATSMIGLARAHAHSEATNAALLHVQKDLYLLMADLATVEGKAVANPRLTSEHISGLEAVISSFESRITMPKQFVAPGDTVAGATLDVARAVVRRTERAVTHLLHAGSGATPVMTAYLNRVSTLLFGLARFEDAQAGKTSTITKNITT